MRVTVRAVRMVQVAADEIIDMITMGHHRVATVGPMHMILRVSCTSMLRRTLVRVRSTDWNLVVGGAA
jgi:hypothetical protein